MSKTIVTVKSPIALNKAQLERVEQVMVKITSNDIVVKNEVENDMLGGINVSFGTKSINLSLENIIKELEQKLDE